MNINLEESPWFHVHFTLPNQTTKRRLINCEGERRRIKNLIQENHTFVSPAKSKRSVRRTNADKQVRSKEEKNVDSKTLNKRSLVIFNCIKDTSDCTAQDTVVGDARQERTLILPPLRGNKYLTSTKASCQQQQVGKYIKVQNHREKEPEKATKPCDKPKCAKSLSIADCYDFCEWRPMNSVFHKPSRTLDSILKHRPRLISQTNISGNETESEVTKTTKRVRFAKGTKFNSSKGRRRNLLDSSRQNEDLSGNESHPDNMFELTFREFIERKRLERSKTAHDICQESTTSRYLKEDSTPMTRKQRKDRKSEHYDPIVDTMLPTIVN